MADDKISALNAKTTVHDTDLFPMVDVEAIPDETKKITGANLKTAIRSWVDYGLSFEGIVTTYTDTTHFASTGLIGLGDGYFIGYHVYVVRDAGGAGAAPQRERQLISGYTSATGAITHTAFTTPLAEGDTVLIQHPSINTKGIDGVYVDSVNGVAGTAYPIGTPGTPVSNLTNAFTIAITRKLTVFYILDSSFTLTIPSSITANFIGISSENNALDINSQNVNYSLFNDLYLSGSPTAGNYITANRCIFYNNSNMSGTFYNCEFQDTITLYAEATPVFYAVTCQFGWVGGLQTPLSLAGNKVGAMLFGCRGQVLLTGLNNANSYIIIYGGDLDVTIDATCIAGTITIYGNVNVINNSTGSCVVIDCSTHKSGKTATFTKNITSAANAGDVTIATITGGTCLIKSIVLRSNGATTADLTSAGIFGGTSKVITFLSAVDAAKANIDATDEQVAWTGAVTLKNGKTVVISLVGTGATAVDLDVDIEYESIISEAYLK